MVTMGMTIFNGLLYYSFLYTIMNIVKESVGTFQRLFFKNYRCSPFRAGRRRRYEEYRTYHSLGWSRVESDVIPIPIFMCCDRRRYKQKSIMRGIITRSYLQNEKSMQGMRWCVD